MNPRPSEPSLARQSVCLSVYSTMLDGLLRSLKIRRLVFPGIATHAGVESTARDASARDFEVTVLSDCVTTFDSTMQAASLKTMTAIGHVVPSQMLFREMEVGGSGLGVGEKHDEKERR